MTMSLDQLLAAANEELEKKATSVATPVDDDTIKLADMLMREEEPRHEETLIEKVARSIAIVETIQAINNAVEIDKFEKVAKENGYSDDEIDKFLGEKGLLPLHQTLNIPEGLWK